MSYQGYKKWAPALVQFTYKNVGVPGQAQMMVSPGPFMYLEVKEHK